MKLSYILTFALGYALGHPAGRERARQVPGQLRELANRPQVQEQVQGLREKGTALAGQATEVAKQRLGRSSDGSNGSDSSDDTDRPGRPLRTRPQRTPGGVEATTTVTPGPVTSGDPVTDVRSAELTDPELAAETEAAALGTLPPKTPGKR
jgi:hypothetical protein